MERGLSPTRACRLVQLPRATFQYQARPDRNAELAEQMRELAAKHPRYGYRRIHALLRRKQRVNKKRIHRLWKRARLQVRKLPRKRRRTAGTGLPVKALYPGHVWTYDFLEDRCQNGTLLRILTVMDEFTREGLVIEVATSIPATRVITILERLVAAHGAPAFIRSDNGPEFVALALRGWLARQHVTTLYIDPGCPWQNGYGESFNGTVRDECLNLYLFATVAEARVRLESYRQHYNTERPHSSLGYRSPTEFKRDWMQAQTERANSNISD
ncbi:MAG: IS3 family transposase [Chloroflexota bacterium]|nr:IS3 family transposase [Chloroflexota bacterium]